MITEQAETKMEFLDDGRINVTIITHYLKDDKEIGQDNWGCCLEPHPAYLDYAREILSDYHYNIVKTAWTSEVISTYAQRGE